MDFDAYVLKAAEEKYKKLLKDPTYIRNPYENRLKLNEDIDRVNFTIRDIISMAAQSPVRPLNSSIDDFSPFLLQFETNNAPSSILSSESEAEEDNFESEYTDPNEGNLM